MAPFLWSFAAAFAHVPSHRRLHLYMSLAQLLGEAKFLYVILIMLADKYEGNQEATAFAVQLCGQYEAETQLIVSFETSMSVYLEVNPVQSAISYLDVVIDALKPERTVSQVLLCLNGSDGRDFSQAAVNVLLVLKSVLSSPTLGARISRSSNEEAWNARKPLVFSSLIQKLLGLAARVKGNEQGKQPMDTYARTNTAMAD